MMKKNYFWGVFLILAGAYLVVSQLGYLPAVGVFSLLFTVVCIAVIVASSHMFTLAEFYFHLLLSQLSTINRLESRQSHHGRFYWQPFF